MSLIDSISIDRRLIVHQRDQQLIPAQGFETYDNVGNPSYQLCEVGVFLDYFSDAQGNFVWPEGRTHVCLFSPKFFQKTNLSIARFETYLGRYLPEYDAVIFNPYPQAKMNRRNLWKRGNRKHPGLLDLTEFISLDRNTLLKHHHGVRYTTYCNYVVANQKFWARYIDYIRPIASDLMSAYQEGKIPDRYFHHQKPLSEIPYFLERCMSDFLLLNDGEIRFKKINRGRKLYLSKFVVEPWSALGRLF
ncbi:MAG: hypothetical protein WBD13_23215 [Burkholderiaceae bacterium]